MINLVSYYKERWNTSMRWRTAQSIDQSHCNGQVVGFPTMTSFRSVSEWSPIRSTIVAISSTSMFVISKARICRECRCSESKKSAKAWNGKPGMIMFSFSSFINVCRHLIESTAVRLISRCSMLAANSVKTERNAVLVSCHDHFSC